MRRLKINVFKRLFLIYSIVIITTLSLLATLVTQNIKSTITKNQIYLNAKMTENVNSYFTRQSENSKMLGNYLYSNSAELWDVINYLNNDYSNYITMRLTTYTNSPLFTYDSINTFVESCFQSSSNIKNVIFYSFKKDDFTIFEAKDILHHIKDVKKRAVNFYKQGKLKQYEINGEDMYINLLKEIDLTNKKSKVDSGRYYYKLIEIKNPYKLDNFGLLILKYKLNEIDSIVRKFDYDKNSILVLDKYGEVLYDSLNKYNNIIYPYYNNLSTSNKPIMLDKNSYIDLISNSSDMSIVGILPENNIFIGYKYIINISYILALILIVISEILAYYKIHGYSERTESIMKAMGELQKGVFKTRIELGDENDELMLISKSFNDMGTKLEGYIEREYLSEISQKNAQIRALQSQINPHFLYNTLESIRMKAISNGDKEVGKMLYILAVLFRNMVKGDTKITISKEIEYCRMYLELFKYRFVGKLDYNISVDPELVNNEIIKFSIQPIIENYIVHGIRPDSDDNIITIAVKRDEEDIEISVEDNGIGIDDNKIKEINENINNAKSSNSMGIINVHYRIRLTYGEKYGVSVRNRGVRGTIVSIKIPAKEGEASV